VEDVRQLRARRRIDRCGMSAQWQQRNRQKSGGSDKRDPAKTEHKCKALRCNADNALPPWGRSGLKRLNADHRQTTDKGSAKKKVHRRLNPVDGRSIGRQAPHDHGTQPTQQAEVLDPVEHRQQEVRAAAHDALAMIPPPRTRVPE
jgi:hypothetical protein